MTPDDLDRLFDRLFPICRSITGPGIRESLEILSEHIPLRIEGIPTGTPVFDWTVPQEWTLRRATLKRTSGETVVSTEDSNLHVVNFSVPFRGLVSRDELQAHLHSIPALPQAIPYVTSYYAERWGLCLPHALRQALTDDAYDVEIDTGLADGVLNYGECVLRGESDDTVLLSSYLCHPSMANNELSGPLVLAGLYRRLAALPRRRFTYRFLLVPETIGSIAYLATRGKELADRIVGGCVLTCLGGPNDRISLKTSRRDWVGRPGPLDRLARDLARTDPDLFSTRDFTPAGGSDERQFCSPGIDWPVIQAARTIYGDYPEYHTNLDDKDFMTIDALCDSVDRLFLMLRLNELADRPIRTRIAGGEPQLGRRGLYPTLNGPMTNAMSNDARRDGRFMLNLTLGLLSLADGTFTLSDIVDKLGVGHADALPILQELLEKDVVEIVT